MTPRQERPTPIAAPWTTSRDHSVSLPAFNYPPVSTTVVSFSLTRSPDSGSAPPLVQRVIDLPNPLDPASIYGKSVREYWHLLTRCPFSSFIGPGQLFPVTGRECPKFSRTLLGSTDRPVCTIHILNSMFSLLIYSLIALVQPVPICPCPENLLLQSLLWLLLRSTGQSVSTSISRSCFLTKSIM
jgi:hypothetical protein